MPIARKRTDNNVFTKMRLDDLELGNSDEFDERRRLVKRPIGGVEMRVIFARTDEGESIFVSVG
jgi:hypothetical protein